MSRRLWATVAVAPLALGIVAAAPTAAGAAAPPLEQVVVTAVEAKTGVSAATRTSAGAGYHADVRRRDGGWAFGMATRSAAPGSTDSPEGWLFLARQDKAGWTVALEGPGFADLAAQAPLSVFGAAEKRVFAQREAVYREAALPGTQAGSGGPTSRNRNTGLQLPYKPGTSWWMTSGPHRWSSDDLDGKWAFLDLAPAAGTNNKVKASGGGLIYNKCREGRVGWYAIVHPNGYTTDYYHLENVKPFADGQWVDVGKVLGTAGNSVCEGGSSSNPHVHWGLRYNDAWVNWHGHTASQWTLWTDNRAEHDGYALRGSQLATRQNLLLNNGTIPQTNGIIDANGGGAVNLRTGPGTNYPTAGSIADGTMVYINCSRVTGASQTGRWGSTPVWNRLPDGRWFADAFAYTGRYFVGPAC